jgi:hypothetical protein
MFKFIFKNGNRTIESKLVRRSPTFARLSSDFTKDFGFITCPNHQRDANATILIDTSSTSYDWQIINSCCPDYKQALELCVTRHGDAEIECAAT